MYLYLSLCCVSRQKHFDIQVCYFEANNGWCIFDDIGNCHYYCTALITPSNVCFIPISLERSGSLYAA